MHNISKISVDQTRGGTWVAREVGSKPGDPVGRGMTSIEAHGDLLERASGHDPSEQSLADRRKA